MKGIARILLLLLAIPAAACGDENTRGRALADSVARQVRKDCESAAAPDAAMRRRLVALCACSEAKIAAMPMRFSDSDVVIGEKVEAATKACREEIGRAPGAPRFRDGHQPVTRI